MREMESLIRWCFENSIQKSSSSTLNALSARVTLRTMKRSPHCLAIRLITSIQNASSPGYSTTTHVRSAGHRSVPKIAKLSNRGFRMKLNNESQLSQYQIKEEKWLYMKVSFHFSVIRQLICDLILERILLLIQTALGVLGF